MTSKESSNPIVSHTCYMARRAPTDTQAVNLEHVTANSTFRLDLRRMFDTLCAQLTYEVWQGRSSLTSLQRGLHGILHLQSIQPMSSRLRSWWESSQFKSILQLLHSLRCYWSIHQPNFDVLRLHLQRRRPGRRLRRRHWPRRLHCLRDDIRTRRFGLRHLIDRKWTLTILFIIIYFSSNLHGHFTFHILQLVF